MASFLISFPPMRTGTALLLAISLLAGCGEGSSTATARPPVPEQWGGIEVLVREAIEEQLGRVEAAPEDAAAWGDLGRTYHANDLVDLAAPCYERSVAMDDADARIWLLLSRVRGELGDVQGCAYGS